MTHPHVINTSLTTTADFFLRSSENSGRLRADNQQETNCCSTSNSSNHPCWCHLGLFQRWCRSNTDWHDTWATRVCLLCLCVTSALWSVNLTHTTTHPSRQLRPERAIQLFVCSLIYFLLLFKNKNPIFEERKGRLDVISVGLQHLTCKKLMF